MSAFRSRFLPATAALTALVTGTLPAQVVSPLHRDRFEGNSSTSYPLGRYDARVQTLHADVGPASFTIQGHAYRRDAIAIRGLVGPFSADLEVVLSDGATTPDRASRTFAQNHGSAPVTVLPRTTISFPATQRPSVDPAGTFELRVPYPTPFTVPSNTPSLCLDVTVHGNQTANGMDRNFLPYLDAHEQFRDGHGEQPGYRYDSGCAAVGASQPHTGRLAFHTTVNGLELTIDSRDGVPLATTVLIVGCQPQGIPYGPKPGCTLLPSLDTTVALPGASDANGDWRGTLAGIGAPSPSQNFWMQLVSGIPGGDVTFSDGSLMTVPPPSSPQITAARIASGSDRTSATGSVSLVVPVTQFF